MRELLTDDGSRTAGIPDLLNQLVAHDHPVRVVYTAGNWLDIDSVTDVERAGGF